MRTRGGRRWSPVVVGLACATGLTCRSPEQPAEVERQALPTVSLKVSSDSVLYRETVLMTWAATNVYTCDAGGAWGGTKPPQGAVNIAPPVWSTYTLTCYGPGGSAADSVRVGPWPQH